MAMAAIPCTASIFITNNEFNISGITRINASFTNSFTSSYGRSMEIRAIKKETNQKSTPSSSSSPDEITQKYGLEAGLWKMSRSKEEDEDGNVKKSNGDQAKQERIFFIGD